MTGSTQLMIQALGCSALLGRIISLKSEMVKLLVTLSNEDDDGKDNSKYNDCTLECIELGTTTEFSLQLER